MNMKKISTVFYGLLLVALVLAPFFGAYPVFVMKLLCFALFASAFNLLLASPGCCPSAMRPSSAARPTWPAMRSRSGASRPNSA